MHCPLFFTPTQLDDMSDKLIGRVSYVNDVLMRAVRSNANNPLRACSLNDILNIVVFLDEVIVMFDSAVQAVDGHDDWSRDRFAIDLREIERLYVKRTGDASVSTFASVVGDSVFNMFRRVFPTFVHRIGALL